MFEANLPLLSSYSGLLEFKSVLFSPWAWYDAQGVTSRGVLAWYMAPAGALRGSLGTV
jgi:hypothetical protein